MHYMYMSAFAFGEHKCADFDIRLATLPFSVSVFTFLLLFPPLPSPPLTPCSKACDHRSQTSLLAAFRNGHVELVDWLLGHVAHLPSEQDCQKALLAPSPPSTDLTPQRARCLEMISKVRIIYRGGQDNHAMFPSKGVRSVLSSL